MPEPISFSEARIRRLVGPTRAVVQEAMRLVDKGEFQDTPEGRLRRVGVVCIDRVVGISDRLSSGNPDPDRISNALVIDNVLYKEGIPVPYGLHLELPRVPALVTEELIRSQIPTTVSLRDMAFLRDALLHGNLGDYSIYLTAVSQRRMFNDYQ